MNAMELNATVALTCTEGHYLRLTRFDRMSMSAIAVLANQNKSGLLVTRFLRAIANCRKAINRQPVLHCDGNEVAGR